MWEGRCGLEMNSTGEKTDSLRERNTRRCFSATINLSVADKRYRDVHTYTAVNCRSNRCVHVCFGVNVSLPWHVEIPNALDKFPTQPLSQTSHKGSHRPCYICLSGCSLSVSMSCYIRLSVLLQVHSEGTWVIQFVFPFPRTVKLIPFTVWSVLHHWKVPKTVNQLQEPG